MADEMNTERDMPEGITRDDTVHGVTYFTASDMATASAQGFRDGVASLSAAEPAPADPPMPETWHVTAHVHGEPILSIGYNWVSGKGELTEAETQAVIGMAHHLLSFVGYGLPPSSFDPDEAEPSTALTQGAAIAAVQPDPADIIAGALQISRGHAIEIMQQAVDALRASHGQAPAQPDDFGSAEHWKEKAQYWAGVAHRLRGEALRGEPVDGIIQPPTPSPQEAPLEFTKEWCMAAAKAEEDSGADISAGVSVSPQAAQQAPAGAMPSDWDMRGRLAASLACWHRLTPAEAEELVALAQRCWTPKAAPQAELDELRRAFAPQTIEQAWTASQSLAYPGKAAQIINAARALLAAPAAPSTPASGGWLSIKKAPKDGTEFLAVYGRQGNVKQLARWNSLYGHWESKGNWLPGFESNVTAIYLLPASPTIEGESNG